MLKKIMFICFAFSLVFIGGIGFALAGDCDRTQKGKIEGPWPNGPVGPEDGSCNDFLSPDSSTLIAKDQIRKRNRLKDGSCQIPFISNNSSIIIAGYDDDKGKGDQKKLRDGSCQG